MIVVVVLGVLCVLTAVWLGSRLMVAGRHLDRVDEVPEGSVAASVDRRLHTVRARVETLVMPEVEAEELRPSVGAHQVRAQTYSVLGLGLLGLAGALVIGFLLLL